MITFFKPKLFNHVYFCHSRVVVGTVVVVGGAVVVAMISKNKTQILGQKIDH